jgi:hypothetical protein
VQTRAHHPPGPRKIFHHGAGQGRIARLDLLTGDRSAEACLRAALAGLSSVTTAQGKPTGTVEITLRARS